MKGQLLRLSEVLEIVKISRATLYKAMGRGTFPRPIKFGASALWRAADVQAWIDGVGHEKSAQGDAA